VVSARRHGEGRFAAGAVREAVARVRPRDRFRRRNVRGAVPVPAAERAVRRMVRDPELYAKGAVRHPDHNTIVLRGWHRVLMNTEQGARAMRHVAFLD
jgi:hypothetical protein